MIRYSISLKANQGADASAYPTKAYATAQVDEIYSLERFARHIADHGSVYSRADITAVLIQAVDCLRELLLGGNKVSLGDLGAFQPVITSTGANTKEEFTTDNITKIGVRWTPGDDLKDLLADAELQYVATRAAQKAVGAAQKAATTTSGWSQTTKDGWTITFVDADDDSESDNDTGNGGTGSGTGSDGTGSDGGSDSGSTSDGGSGSGSDSGSGSGSDSGSGSGMEGE